MRAELMLEPLGGLVVERQNQHPGGVLIDAVDDEHSPVSSGAALDCGAGARDHRVLLARMGGVNDETGRFVDDDKIVIQVQDLDRRCGRCTAHAPAIGVVGHNLVGADLGAGVGDDLSVDKDVADLDGVLRLGVGRAEDLMGDTGEPARRHGSRVASVIVAGALTDLPAPPPRVYDQTK